MPQPDPQVCPLHTDEFVRPVFVGSETADYTFTCPRTDHPTPGTFTWSFVPEPSSLPGDSLGLGLDIELPKAVATASDRSGRAWVEYGLIEHAYAAANPDDWSTLLARYGHTHYQPPNASLKEFPYTASKYLARSLGALGARGVLLHAFGPGTGRWDYNKSISYYALPAGGDWSQRQTWVASGIMMDDYMPAVRPH